ncbi:phosphatidylglycerophosphatase A [Alteromonas sp. 38]|uniref:phosphatidylglycerophosphatase A family protein n=1 Tax=Alteromonas TaxID=226 RepID=UPI0012F3FFE1|nr:MULTISPECIES: phosphatidylglycerophosphatase A [Alteromonas]CAD5266477.1 phosphatidylglycerophosphatase A [Alteromonas sp. 154]VXC05766.1 phosphatidylglycerophosphatase A [Alteromonas sp. 38]
MQKEYRARISMKNPVHFLALGFGSGLVPFMPGTFGSAAALPLLMLSANMPVIAFIAFTVFASIIGIYLCGKTADDMQVHDHGSIVWDEVAGMFITFLFVPITAPSLLAGFVLFRIFDILKPWPIGPIDKRLHGGTGIMLDDIVAGAMACACLHIMMLVWPAFTTLF